MLDYKLEKERLIYIRRASKKIQWRGGGSERELCFSGVVGPVHWGAILYIDK